MKRVTIMAHVDPDICRGCRVCDLRFLIVVFWGAALCFRRECRLYHHSLAEGRPS